MPTPREAYVNTVDRQGYSGARVQPADYGAAGEIIGRAVEGFGRDVQQTARNIDETQTIYATAAAKDALVQALPRLSAVRQSFASLTKKDAIGARDRATTDIDAIEQEIGGQLKDRRAQRMFKEAFLDRKLSALESIASHEAEQVLAYNQDTDKALYTEALNQAADNVGNPDEMMAHISTAQSIAARLNPGASDDEIRVVQAATMSKALVGAWSQIEDPLDKEAFRAAHSAEILPADEAEIIRSNASGLFDARGDIIEQDFFKTVETGGVPVVQPGQADEPPVALAPSPPRSANPLSGRDYSPVMGARRGDDSAAHARRGSHNMGIDFAAPAGSAIRPAMSGTVVERGFNSDNGNYVKVKYDNGYTGIFLHMKGPAAVAQGAKVEPGTVIGAVGSTGHSSGPHCHYSVRGPDGNYVNPDTVSYQADRTGVIRNKPQDVDTASLYDKAYAYAEAHNLSLRETNQLLQRIDVRANRDRQLQNDRDRVLTDQAMTTAYQLGDSLTKRSQIPGIDNLPWEAQARIDNLIEANTRPPAVDANSETWRTLLELKIEHPDQFVNYDVRSLKGKITDAQITAALTDQAKLRKGDGSANPAAIDNYTRIRDIAKRYQYRVADVNKDGKLTGKDEIGVRDRFISAIERRIEKRIAENGGKDISMREYDQIAGEEAMLVYVDEKPMWRFVTDEKGIPASRIHIRKIDNAKKVWRTMYPGRPYPSDAELMQMAAGE